MSHDVTREIPWTAVDVLGQEDSNEQYPHKFEHRKQCLTLYNLSHSRENDEYIASWFMATVATLAVSMLVVLPRAE